MLAVTTKGPGRQGTAGTAIAASTSQADVLAALKLAAEAYDFTYVTLLMKPIETDDLLARVLIQSTLPSEFVREFDQQRFLPRCPSTPALFATLLPQAWTLDTFEADCGIPLPRDIARLMRDFGLATTAAMPLHSLEGDRFLLRFDGRREAVEQGELNELAMIALHAFDVFEKLRRSERFALPSPLSTRELEVVRWTAQGKTSVEIGRILSLSDHTINAHMTNAIKKLDCVNRTQLVAKAIRLGLIN